MSAIAIDPLGTLSRVALFADLSHDELRALAHRSILHQAHAGDILFREGDACEGLYVVETGSVKIYKTSPAGREQMLTVDGPGNSIAEVPVFDGGPYPASAMALTESTLLFVSKRDFRALVLEHPEVGLKVLRAVGSRLRRLVGLIEELSFTTVRARMIKLLLRNAQAVGVHTERGTEITLPTNQELASQVGTVRELVSRNLSRIQAEGLVRLDGKVVVIPDLAALETAAEEP